MFRTITATYDNKTTVVNVVDDLINHGLPREKIYSDEDAMQVKVMIPETSEPEIDEILGRHRPNKMVHG